MKRILLLLTIILTQLNLTGQVYDPCLPAANGVPAGDDAPGCLLCEPPYNGSTDGYSPSAPGSAGFPCGTIENNQFISIIPDENQIIGTILASNCANTQGVQLIIYDQSFNPISNCFASDGTSSNPSSFTAAGVTPGEIYWIMIDGFGGDICDIELAISSSIVTSGPATAPIEAIPQSDSACTEEVITYFVPITPGAIEYLWEVSSHGFIVSGQGNRAIDVEWTTAGIGYVRVSAVACDPGPQEERSIEIFEKKYSGLLNLEFCESEFPVNYNGQTIPDEGYYSFTYIAASGCDSIVEYDVTKLLNEVGIISANICIGESYSIAGQTFNQSGMYSVTVPGVATNGCDSIYELDLIVLQHSHESITKSLCPDETFTIGGQTFDEAGNYQVIVPNAAANGCDSIYQIEILELNSEYQQVSVSLCAGNTFQFKGQTFSIPGYYEIIVSGAATNGCDSVYELDLFLVPGLTEIAPVTEIDCIPGATLTINSINSAPSTIFQWSTDSSGNILSGTSDSLIVVDASAEYYLMTSTLVNGTNCSNFDTVFVPERPTPLPPTFDTISNFHCNFDTGLLVVNSVFDADSLYWIFENRDTFKTVLSDTFQYAYQDGGFYNLKLAAENVCGIGNSTDTVLMVKPIDLPAINLFSNRTCVGDTLILKTPKLDSAVTLKWLLDGGKLITTPLQDSFRIVWNAPGQKILQLTTIQDTCESDFVSDTVQIDAPFSTLNFNCNSTTNEVLFSWKNLPGADIYNVRVLTGQAGNLVDTTFRVTGLSPNEQVSIEVEVSGSNTCGSAVFTQTCLAQNCPTVNVSIDPVSDICLTPSTLPIQLTAQISGGIGGGNFNWSGSGISSGGIFDPQLSSIGNQVIELKYSEGSCEYLANTTINVFQTPTADFTLISPICIDQNSTLNYIGNASPSANYNWNFNLGNIVTNSGSTNYEINFPTSGTYVLQLQVTENGCMSNVETKSIQVDAPIGEPVIFCDADANQIVFSWNNLTGATNYDVQVPTGQTGTLSGNSFTVSGLSAGEEVSVLVTAETNSVCGNTQASLTCESLFCPPGSVLLDANPPTICAGEISNFQLNPIDTGAIIFDSVLWSGQIVSLDGKINYDTLVSGNYSVFAEAYKGGCVYSDTFHFEVYPETQISAKILSPLWYPNVLGGVDLTVEKGTPPFEYNWSNGSFEEDLSEVNRALLHCVTVTDQNGCEETDCYIIGEGIYRISPLQVICRGGSKRLSVRPSRGATFSWSPSDDLSCNDCPNPIASPSQSTTYNVTATMPDGRTASTKVIVMVLLPPLCNTLAARSDSDIEALISNFESRNFEEADLPFLEKELIKTIEKEPIKIVPNPTSGLVRIQSFSTIEKVEVFDFSGRLIFATSDKEIDLSAEAKGVYFFKIKTNGKTEIRRVVLF